MFVQGSLAFTGNLNLIMAQLLPVQLLLWKTSLIPKRWEKAVKHWDVDVIYLIPSKLMCIPDCFNEKNVNIKMILSGSQSLGKKMPKH